MQPFLCVETLPIRNHRNGETHSPKESFPGEPDGVLLNGFPGEEQDQQQHEDTEECGAPAAGN